MAGKLPLYKQVTIYFSKHERNFFQKLQVFVKEEYPDQNMSWFIVMCVKYFINTALNPQQKKRFRHIGYELANKEVPEHPEFVKNIKKEKKRNERNSNS